MSPDILARAGVVLCGEDWRRPLARLLGPHHPDGHREEIDPRLVSRWSNGVREIPPWVADATFALLQDLVDDLEERAAEAGRVSTLITR